MKSYKLTEAEIITISQDAAIKETARCHVNPCEVTRYTELFLKTYNEIRNSLEEYNQSIP